MLSFILEWLAMWVVVHSIFWSVAFLIWERHDIELLRDLFMLPDKENQQAGNKEGQAETRKECA